MRKILTYDVENFFELLNSNYPKPAHSAMLMESGIKSAMKEAEELETGNKEGALTAEERTETPGLAGGV